MIDLPMLCCKTQYPFLRDCIPKKLPPTFIKNLSRSFTRRTIKIPRDAIPIKLLKPGFKKKSKVNPGSPYHPSLLVGTCPVRTGRAGDGSKKEKHQAARQSLTDRPWVIPANIEKIFSY
jgi:hypothetical protein